MLDNVLDATHWPLERNCSEAAANKRRVGLGFTGLGDALASCLACATTPEARAMATKITEFMRDASSYLYSVELAKERGAFPLFNADMYLSGGNFASRLPNEVKDQDPQARPAQFAPALHRAYRHDQPGLRRQRLERHRAAVLLDLQRAKSAWPDGTLKEYSVEDYAWRLYKHMGGDVSKLPEYFVTALEISAQAHKDMVAAVAPHIDTSISKTVNVPAEYPYEDFQDLYMSAWKSGLKGLATYRPNSVLGSVLSVD